MPFVRPFEATSVNEAVMESIPARLIIHGGAGNISRDRLPPESWQHYEKSLSHILNSTQRLLDSGKMDALDAVVYAVSLFELNPLWNCGKGAVFNTAGRVELEASVMVSSGKRKRGAAVSLIKHVKHPIQLAAEILKRGEDEDAGGAQGHVHLSGEQAEQLARRYRLEMCDESYFWTRKRWEEHRKGLHPDGANNTGTGPDGKPWHQNDPTWDGHEYLPQGTVGAVAVDRTGLVAVATSTGGLTNKLPGRIGDTPTFGAGFWAEQWENEEKQEASRRSINLSSYAVWPALSMLRDCMPAIARPNSMSQIRGVGATSICRAVAMSGTGNGDSFLRLAATRSAAAKAQYSGAALANAVSWMAGEGGQLQKSAGDRFGRTGEGEGGIIGIEVFGHRSIVVWDFNCGGLFRAYFDEAGKAVIAVFKDKV